MKSLTEFLVEAKPGDETSHTEQKYSVLSYDHHPREDDIPWHPKNHKVHGHGMSHDAARALAKKVHGEKMEKHRKKKVVTAPHSNADNHHGLSLRYTWPEGTHSVHVTKD